MTLRLKHWAAPALTAVALAITGCGGSGADTSTTGAGTGTIVTTETRSLRLSGTAASRAALADAGVEARCATGRGVSTTRSNGGYDINIERGALPWALRVVKRGSDSTAVTLHSVTSGPASETTAAITATANITPATELVVASLAGTAPATYFEQFESAPAAAAAVATTANVQNASTAVVDTLKAGGVDLSAAGNVLTAALVPSAGSTAGNAYGQVLETLDTRVTAGGTTLVALAEAVAAASSVSPPATTSAAATLPAASLLQTAAANCSALRSGNYRFLGLPSLGAGGAVVALDAAALTIALPNGAIKLTANGNCRYRTPTNGEMVVSPAGVLVGQGDVAPYRLVMAFAEQKHKVADLAGDWNGLGMNNQQGVKKPFLLVMSYNSAGRLTRGVLSEGALTTTQVFNEQQVPVMGFSLNSAGGFNLTNTTDTPNWTDRVFAYRSGSGELMKVQVNDDSLVLLSTRKRILTAPVLGSVSDTWNLFMTPQATSPSALSQSYNTWVSVNGPDNYTRNAVLNFTTGVTRPEVILRNNPQDGFSRRQAATVSSSDGATSSVSSWVAVGLRGMGISSVVFPNGNWYISVEK
jgi:hypothetical protein